MKVTKKIEIVAVMSQAESWAIRTALSEYICIREDGGVTDEDDLKHFLSALNSLKGV